MSNDVPTPRVNFMSEGDRAMPVWLEDAWMQRYLDRELSDAEVHWFESYCLERDHLLARIEADLEVRDLLDAHSDVLRQAVRPPGSARGWAWLRPAAAAAACLVLGLAIGNLVPLSTGSPGLAVLEPNVTRLMFDTYRGTESAVRVDHAASRSASVLLDVAVPDQAEAIAVHVGDARIDGLHASSDGFISALVPRDALRARRLSITYSLHGATVARELAVPERWESSP